MAYVTATVNYRIPATDAISCSMPHPSTPLAARTAGRRRRGRTPDPPTRSGGSRGTRTPAHTTDGTGASPEQSAGHCRDQEQLTTRDNAAIEAWHSTLEFELRSLEHFTTPDQARRAVAGFIDEYNTTRTPRSACSARSTTSAPTPVTPPQSPDPPGRRMSQTGGGYATADLPGSRRAGYGAGRPRPCPQGRAARSTTQDPYRTLGVRVAAPSGVSIVARCCMVDDHQY